eukprot:2996235-Amphidinium_carterae.1
MSIPFLFISALLLDLFSVPSSSFRWGTSFGSIITHFPNDRGSAPEEVNAIDAISSQVLILTR